MANSGDGVAVYSADNEIQDDLISANRSIGIYLAGSSASGNAIEGCGIGTNLAETGALGNGTWGVIINDAPGNTVGGSASGAGNVISGNDQGGIAIYGGTSVGDVVQGNKIGTDVTGTLGLGNAYSGIDVGLGTGFSPGSPGSASDAIIGGTAAGDGNVISDNGNFGVSMGLGGAGTTGIVVQGNQIGTSADGTEALPNAYGAIFLDQVTNSTIGGTTAAQRNIISGNSYAGVNIQSSTGILVAGNYIGTNAAGTAALANAQDGVLIYIGSSANTIGGTAAGAGNVISGNSGDGVLITGTGATGNLIEGNYIGTNAAGSAALGNAYNGVEINGASSDNTIGGTVAGARNVISANANWGVVIWQTGTSGNLVEGDYIGTNAAGTATLGNVYGGVGVYTAGNIIGGAAAGAGNVISGNSDGGVYLDPAGGSTLLEGNDIGTNAAGTAALANGDYGVYVAGSDNTIGGGTSGSGNVISGNAGNGVEITGSGATGNLVAGNLIGTNLTGTAALGNSAAGVAIQGSATGNTIGGTSAGAANLISGNASQGVLITGLDSSGNLVAGNLIGTNLSGTAALGNAQQGVAIQGNAIANTIGGTAAAARNVISGNSNSGIYIGGSGTTGNLVVGNYIGTSGGDRGARQRRRWRVHRIVGQYRGWRGCRCRQPDLGQHERRRRDLRDRHDGHLRGGQHDRDGRLGHGGAGQRVRRGHRRGRHGEHGRRHSRRRRPQRHLGQHECRRLHRRLGEPRRRRPRWNPMPPGPPPWPMARTTAAACKWRMLPTIRSAARRPAPATLSPATSTGTCTSTEAPRSAISWRGAISGQMPPAAPQCRARFTGSSSQGPPRTPPSAAPPPGPAT